MGSDDEIKAVKEVLNAVPEERLESYAEVGKMMRLFSLLSLVDSGHIFIIYGM